MDSKKFELDLTKVPKELKLMMEILASESGKFSQKPHLFEGIDWDYFLELSLHHRVYPILYSRLKHIKHDLVPEEVREAIAQQYKRNTFKMLHLSGEMEHVSKLFSNQDLPLLFLKGPALAHELYGDISFRTSSDLDILIPLNQLERAKTLLEKEGYEKNDYIQTVLNDWKWRHHHITFYHPKKGIKLEVHWRLNPGPSKEPEFQALWERRTTSRLTSTPVYMLSMEDLFLFLVSHGSRHGWSRLRWLLDVDRMMEQGVDWKLCRKRLHKYHDHRAGGQGILLASLLFKTEVPYELKHLAARKSVKQLAQQAVYYIEHNVHLHADTVPEAVSRFHKRHLFALMDFRQKCMFMMSFLYPYPEDQQTLSLPKLLHFLYFPLRPFLWGWRKLRKQPMI
ncbi:nucleotidyltransferase family protein [Virgibacillus oceani]